MKTYNCKFLLFSLALFLIVTTLTVYSEVNPEESDVVSGNNQTNDVSTTESEGDKNLDEQSSEKHNPLEEKVNNLENRLNNLQENHDNFVDESTNSSTIFPFIFRAVIFIALVVIIFLGLRLRQELRTEVKSIRDTVQNRLKQNEESFDNRLNLIIQQGKDRTQRIDEIESKHPGFQNKLSQQEKRIESFKLTLANMKLSSAQDDDEKSQDEVKPQDGVHRQIEEIVQESQVRIEALTQAYENGEPFYYVDIENPTPTQNLLLDLNWLARSIDDWKKDLEESETANQELTQTLGFANQVVKDKLMAIRRQAPPPLPLPLNLDTDVVADQAIGECNIYVSKYEGMLNGYQLQLKVDQKEYDQFIPNFIKDRLFMGVVRNSPFDQIPEQLKTILDFAGYEVIPIEIGKTEATSHLHDIQRSQRTSVKSGTIAEVISPGLRRIDNGDIVQKPSVIRAE